MTAVKPKRGHPWKTATLGPKGPKPVIPSRDYSDREGAIFGKRYGTQK